MHLGSLYNEGLTVQEESLIANGKISCSDTCREQQQDNDCQEFDWFYSMIALRFLLKQDDVLHMLCMGEHVDWLDAFHIVMFAKKRKVAYPNKASVQNLTTQGGTVTLYAVWAKKDYKVRFNANGGKGSMSDESFTYGKSKKLSAKMNTPVAQATKITDIPP